MAELGENIVIRRFTRYLVGEPLDAEASGWGRFMNRCPSSGVRSDPQSARNLCRQMAIEVELPRLVSLIA